jgi:hypothetical protein
MISEIITRLEQAAPLLSNVEGAAAFSALVAANKKPTGKNVAYVVPTGMRGTQSDASAGAFIQGTSETISVIIMLRSNDSVGSKGVEPVEAIKAEVINALCGWRTSDEVGVFELRGGRMVSVLHGLLTYSLEFSISDQVRIYS